MGVALTCCWRAPVGLCKLVPSFCCVWCCSFLQVLVVGGRGRYARYDDVSTNRKAEVSPGRVTSDLDTGEGEEVLGRSGRREQGSVWGSPTNSAPHRAPRYCGVLGHCQQLKPGGSGCTATSFQKRAIRPSSLAPLAVAPLLGSSRAGRSEYLWSTVVDWCA